MYSQMALAKRGAPIAVLEDGDTITIDAETGRLAAHAS